MKAARAGHLCTVQFLISKGANVNRATTNNDHTVVSLACAGGHLAVVELLLAHGADPTHRLKDGSTMLIEAAKGGHTNVVSYLLDYPNNVLSVPTTDVSQLTSPSQDESQVPRVPIHTLAMVVPPQEPDRTSQETSPALLGVQKAAEEIDFVPVQPLSSPQCNFSSDLGSNGTNSLVLQKVSGNQQIVGQPQIAIAGHEQGLLVQEPDGLMVATPAQTLTDTLDDLIADINAQIETNRNTALTLACFQGRAEVVSLLLDRKANVEHRAKELLKKCHQCVETIVKAKDQQAAEANKNASILLKELDLEKGLPISMYGGTIIPSHPQLADVPGGPLFNGLHNPDPAWNPMIKVIQNSTECTDAQQFAMSTSTSCPIPGCRDQVSDGYSTTPGGTLYATTPGGTRIIYDRKFLLQCKNSPIARTPPCCLPQIPGVTTRPTVPPSKLELLKEQKQTEEEITDDEQFEMDM
ncbi:hypothetical protein NN561_017408 [Cricetulus griseus]